jgi:sucrose-6-phosphate hydrolase SacC (GH32 family)
VHTVQLGPFELAGKEPLKLQIFIDASVIEVFANGRAV